MYFELSEIVNDLELKNFIKILHNLVFQFKYIIHDDVKFMINNMNGYFELYFIYNTIFIMLAFFSIVSLVPFLLLDQNKYEYSLGKLRK